MDFRILGPLEVRDGNREVGLRGGKQRALLALLLVNANRSLAIDRIVDDLWGEDVPESAQKMVQIYVSKLRKVLAPGTLITRPPGYSLQLAPDELDLDRFQRLAGDARASLDAGRATEASAGFRAALELWRGPALAEFTSEPFALGEAARLEDLRLHALEGRLEADLQLGRHGDLVGELEALIARYPLHEGLRRQHMLALYRSDRQAEALAAYQQARRALSDELGIEPSPALRVLERQILQQDSRLDLAPSREPVVRTDATAARSPGHASPVERGAAEERRTVTVLAADVLPDSSPDDPEARRAALRERSDAAKRELERHGAAVRVLGTGGVLGLFGIPSAHDDDSLRAVRAALALRAAELAKRVGLATGEVVTGDPFVAGTAVDQALSLRDAAVPHEVLAETRTWRLVRHAVEASRRESAWAIASVDPEAAPLARHFETSLVGRTREVGQITAEFERAARDGKAHLVTIFGAPGIGKTRLAIECVQHLRDTATSAFGRCRAAAQESTYAPLREVLAGIAEGDLESWIRDRLEPHAEGAQLAAWLAAAVGLGSEPGRPEETAWAARRLLGGLADERPLLIILDDVHWAAPAFLDLVESLVELTRAPMLVLCLARPDLLDLRPHWGGGRLSSSSVLLDVLTEAESDTLLDRLAPEGEVDGAARERILTVAEGNPLFIEQLLADTLEGHAEAVPDSIQSLLAARLDRLNDEDRAVAQAAAVCGTSFTTEEVAELVGSDPSASLLTLVRRELIRPGEADDPGGTGWSFRHSLIRDVAYGGLTKRRRADLHERLAQRAIESDDADVDVVAGYHLDQAASARREAGEHGADVDVLAARAADHLGRAGVAAYERDDMAAAWSLLGRANALLPREAPERIELLPKLADSFVVRGEVAAAQGLLAEAHAIAVELRDARLAARVTLAADLTLLFTDAAVPPERMLGDIEQAVPVLEQAGDYEGLAMAEALRFNALDRAGLRTAAQFPLALAYARRANARHLQHYVMSWICITLHRGALPVDEAIALATEIRDTSTSTYARTSAIGALGLLRAMKGEFDDARALVEEVRNTLEDLGLGQAAAAHSIAIAEVEAIAGDDATAERILRAGYAAVTARGDAHSAMNVAWRLGLALARQGRDDEAEPFVRIAQRAEHRGFWVEVWWRVVLALIEAHRGNAVRARELVDESRHRMASVHESGFHADALLEGAEALRAAGHEDEAATVVVEAAAIADRLGYIVARDRAEQAQRAPTA